MPLLCLNPLAASSLVPPYVCLCTSRTARHPCSPPPVAHPPPRSALTVFGWLPIDWGLFGITGHQARQRKAWEAGTPAVGEPAQNGPSCCWCCCKVPKRAGVFIQGAPSGGSTRPLAHCPTPCHAGRPQVEEVKLALHPTWAQPYVAYRDMSIGNGVLGWGVGGTCDAPGRQSGRDAAKACAGAGAAAARAAEHVCLAPLGATLPRPASISCRLAGCAPGTARRGFKWATPSCPLTLLPISISTSPQRRWVPCCATRCAAGAPHVRGSQQAVHRAEAAAARDSLRLAGRPLQQPAAERH